jgi:hypothetical protein
MTPVVNIADTYLWLLSLLEELLLALLLLTLFPGEVLVTSYLVDFLLVNAGEIDLVGCGNNITGIDPSERDAVDFEWTGDEEDALLERLEEYDTLATESASEEDEDRAGGKSCSRS